MSLTNVSASSVNATLIAQLEASLGQTVPWLPKSFTRVLAKVLAGQFVLLYKYAGFIFLQMFVSRASFQPTEINGQILRPLVEWGRLIGVGDPTPATQAELTVIVTVENQTGSLPAGTQFVGPNNGVTYILLTALPLDAATVTGTVRAVGDQAGGDGGGAAGNLEPGDPINLANPIANVARAATVATQVVAGADAETEDAYRARVIERFQAVPQGGALVDYVLWGKTVAGIVSIYPYTGLPNEIDVYVEATEASSGSADGIPTAAQLAAVTHACYFDEDGFAKRAPAGVVVNTYTITRSAFDVTVAGLAVDDTVSVQASIEAGLDSYLRGLEPYIVGVSRPPAKDFISSTNATAVVSDIVTAAGGSFDALVVYESAVPLTRRDLGQGEEAKLGVVTYA